MQQGFPLQLLDLVRCSHDAGELQAMPGVTGPFVPDGAVRCMRCGRLHHIRNGVLSLLDPLQLHAESTTEMRVRDARNEGILEGTRPEWSSVASDEIEVRPTLDAIGNTRGMRVCEIGCGPGRYTLELAHEDEAVVAVDFSLAGLLVLRKKLQPTARVALVQPDNMRDAVARVPASGRYADSGAAEMRSEAAS